MSTFKVAMVVMYRIESVFFERKGGSWECISGNLLGNEESLTALDSVFNDCVRELVESATKEVV
jgi:hypothetical protein